MEFCIYCGINVQVDSLDGEHISEMCQCTGSQPWGGWNRQTNWW
jgi:hypothetical protein